MIKGFEALLGGTPSPPSQPSTQPQPQDTQPRKEDTPNQLRDMMREMLRR